MARCPNQIATPRGTCGDPQEREATVSPLGYSGEKSSEFAPNPRRLTNMGPKTAVTVELRPVCRRRDWRTRAMAEGSRTRSRRLMITSRRARTIATAFCSEPPWPAATSVVSPASICPTRRREFGEPPDPTDRSYPSIGCAVLFLNFLRYQLHFTWAQIVGAGAPTLSATYTKLTGHTDGWTRFSSLVTSKYPAGIHSGVRIDNIFPI